MSARPSGERVVVVCPHGIGNLVMTLPALLTLRRGFPGSEVHLVSLLPSTTQMLREWPVFRDLWDSLHEVRSPRGIAELPGALASIAPVRRLRPTVCLVTFPSLSFHYNLLAFLTGAPRRIGSVYPDSRPGNLAWLNTDLRPVAVGLHDVEQNLGLVRLLGEPAEVHSDFSAARPAYERPRLPVVGIHTGCKRGHEHKQWRRERFASVVERLLADGLPFGIRLFFGPDEAGHLDYFRRQPWASRVELVSGLELLETCRRVGECSVFLSNDSGLMHLAVLSGCPRVIAIVGPSDPRRTGPFDPAARLVRADLDCMPCSHTYSLASRRFRCVRQVQEECLERVTEERVREAVVEAVEALARPGAAAS